VRRRKTADTRSTYAHRPSCPPLAVPYHTRTRQSDNAESNLGVGRIPKGRRHRLHASRASCRRFTCRYLESWKDPRSIHKTSGQRHPSRVTERHTARACSRWIFCTYLRRRYHSARQFSSFNITCGCNPGNRVKIALAVLIFFEGLVRILCEPHIDLYINPAT